MAREDATHQLDAFRAGKWPDAHAAIHSLFVSECRGTRVLDLCCGHGLLGQRLAGAQGVDYVLGIDDDAPAMAAGREYGVAIEMLRLDVCRANLDELAKIIRRARITVVIARLCLSELIEDHPEIGVELAAALDDAGVDEVFVEGRVRHPFTAASVEGEIDALASRYVVVRRRPAMAYLRSRVPNRYRKTDLSLVTTYLAHHDH